MKDKIYDTILTYPEDYLNFERCGADPFSAHDSGVALSSYWRVWIGEKEMPVLATPVTHAGPHSFCQIPWQKNVDSGKICFVMEYYAKVYSAQIVVEQKEVPCKVEDNKIYFELECPNTFTLEVNNCYNKPLTVFVEEEKDVLPQVANEKVIYFEPGIHYVDNIVLESGQTLYIEKGALIRAVPPDAKQSPVIEKDWAGKPNYVDFISAEEQNNITITGGGIIDVSALPWHARRTILFKKCKDVTIEGVTLIGAAHWTVLIDQCKQVHIDAIKLFGYRENSDGIDIVNCENILVENCFVRTGDDAICVKSMQPAPVIGGKNTCVENCTIWNDKVRALGITGETRGDISDVIFRKCTILHSMPDWAREIGSLCIILVDSGAVFNILFEDIVIFQENSYAINCMVFKDRWSTDEQAGKIFDITFKNIKIADDAPLHFWGYSQENTVENISLQDVTYLSEKTDVADELRIETNQYIKKL